MSYITKDNVAVFLDKNKDLTMADMDLVRICLSEIFELTMGEEEVERNFIIYPNKSTDVVSNNLELPQENIMDPSDPAYNFMFEHFKSHPTGQDCLMPVVICFPDETTGKYQNGADAWAFVATIKGKVLKKPDQKISYTIKEYGEIVDGTYTVTEVDNQKVTTFVPSTP